MRWFNVAKLHSLGPNEVRGAFFAPDHSYVPYTFCAYAYEQFTTFDTIESAQKSTNTLRRPFAGLHNERQHACNWEYTCLRNSHLCSDEAFQPKKDGILWQRTVHWESREQSNADIADILGWSQSTFTPGVRCVSISKSVCFDRRLIQHFDRWSFFSRVLALYSMRSASQ